MGTNFFSQHFVNEPPGYITNNAGEEYFSQGGEDIDSPEEIQTAYGRWGKPPPSTINGGKIRYRRGYFYAPDGAIKDWHKDLQIRMLRASANDRVLDLYLSTGRYLHEDNRSGSSATQEYWRISHSRALHMQNQDQGGNTKSYKAPYGRDDLDAYDAFVNFDDKFKTDSSIDPDNWNNYTFTADSTTDRITVSGAVFDDNDTVYVSSAGTLPNGLSAGVTYWANHISGGVYELWPAHPDGGGSRAPFSDNGSGTHTVWKKGHPESDYKAGIHHPGHDRLNVHYFRHASDTETVALRNALAGQAREADEQSDPASAAEGPMRWGEPLVWEAFQPQLRYAGIRHGDSNSETRHWDEDISIQWSRVLGDHWANPEVTEVGVLMEMYYISPED